jgi:exonuclease VII small subunit
MELENATLSLETAVRARDEAQAVVDSCQQRVDAAAEALENCMDEHNVEPNPQAP